MRAPTAMEMQVARAIWDQREEKFPAFTRMTWAQGTDQARSATLAIARSSIEAMRRPTPEIVAAAEAATKGAFNRTLWDHLWPAVIDAASPPDA